MFCPKCGVSNPDNGKFCRGCGTDLSHVTGALQAKPAQAAPVDRRGRPLSMEHAIRRIFSGIAFLIIAIILGVTNAAGGRVWWFWMLIPAFGLIGAGVAQYLQFRSLNSTAIPAGNAASNSVDGANLNSLPPQQVDYTVSESRYKTGDLVPPSVTDNTTRQLEIDNEGETMTLPKR